jgi:hypothetical protein
MHSDTVVDAVRRWLAGRSVGCDHEGLVTGSTEMLQHPDHRVADAVDVREKGLGDNRYTHATTVTAPPVDMVTDWHTRHEL